MDEGGLISARYFSYKLFLLICKTYWHLDGVAVANTASLDRHGFNLGQTAVLYCVRLWLRRWRHDAVFAERRPRAEWMVRIYMVKAPNAPRVT